MTKKTIKKSVSIKTSILFFFVLMITGSTLLSGILIFSSWISSDRLMMNQMAESLNADIDSEVSAFIDIPKHINEMNSEWIENGIIDLQNASERERFFVSVLLAHQSDIYSFSFGTETGEYYGARRNANGEVEIMRNNADTLYHTAFYTVTEDLTAGEYVSETTTVFDARTRDWYIAAKAAGEPTFSPIYKHFILNDMTVSASYPIYDESDVLIGVLGTHVILSGIDTFLKHTVSDTGGLSAIIELETGAMIGNSLDFPNLTLLDDVSVERTTITQMSPGAMTKAYERYLSRGETRFTIHDNQDTYYFNLTEYHDQGVDWLILSAIPKSHFGTSIVTRLLITLTILIVTIVMAIGLYLLYVKQAFLPIQSLIGATKSYAAGDFSARISISRNDEVGNFSAAINTMADQIEHAMLHLEEEVAERTKHLEEAKLLLQESNKKLSTEMASRAQGERLLNMFFEQALSGFFFMMMDKPIEWKDTVDKEAALEYIFDHQRITRVNPAMLDQYRMSEAELMQKTPRDMFAHNLEEGKATWRKMLDAGKLHVETDERRSDGTPISIEGDYICMYDDLGRFIGHFGNQFDVTERNNTERKLLQNQKNLNESQRIAHLGTWRLDVATNEVIWSDELYKMYGFDPKLPPPPYTEHMKLFTPQSWNLLSTSLAQTSTLGIPYELELEMVTKDGSTGWMWVRGEAEKNADGKIIAIWGAAQDITHRMKLQNQWKDSEERYRLLYSSMSQGLALHQIITDPAGKPIDYVFLDCNDSYSKMLGWNRQEILGKRILELIPDLEPYWIEVFGKVALSGEPMYYENYLHATNRHYATFTYCLKKGQFAVLVTDITERKMMENALRESNEKYIAIFDKSPIAIEFYDASGTLMHANDACVDLFGVIDRKELSGFQLFNNPNLDAVTIAKIRKLERIHQEINFSFDEVKRLHLYQTKHTGMKILSLSITPLLNENRLSGYVVQTEDITDRKKAESALTHSRDLLSYIVDHANGGVAVHDRDLNYMYVSAKYRQEYGVVDKDIIGKHHYDVFPDLPQKWRDVHQLALKGIVSRADNDPYVHADGSVDWTRWECRPWYESNSVIGGIIVYTEVINEQKRLEQELLKEKETLIATLHSIGDGVISTDAFGKITAMNAVAEALTGWNEVDALSKPFEEVFHIVSESSDQLIENPVQSVIRSQQIMEMADETVLISKTGLRHYIDDSASPIKSSRGEIIGVVLVFRDVTEKKQKIQEIDYLSKHDYLTGLYNRRYYVEAYNLFVRATRYPLGVMMMDVNGLKIVNDAYGHDIGDIALKTVAEVLTETFGPSDVVARIGGDEFAILLPNTTLETMQGYKDALRTNLSTRPILNISLSLAIGYEAKTDDQNDLDEMLKMAENHMYRHKLAEGVSVRNRAIQAILSTLTDKYQLEKTHSERVSSYAKMIGEAMGLRQDDLKELEMAGLFHDIGKISIPDIILDKPGKLTNAEYDTIKTHTEIGYQILRAADEYSDLAIHALHHHERWDGRGYPSGLKEKETPLFSRIIGIVDAFEAMTADRPYKKTKTMEQAVEELRRCAGTQFDPELVTLFIEQVLIHLLT